MSSKNREIEIRLFDVDVPKIISILKKNNAKLVQKKVLFKIFKYNHPQDKKDSMIRIRDEGKNITMTIKTDLKAQFVIEREIIINNMEEGDAILKFLGCTTEYTVEKFREIWQLKGCKEIVFDTYPGLPTYMEIDCHSLDSLKKVAKLLGYSIKDHTTRGAGDLYYELYGIKQTKEEIKKTNLTFKNAKQKLKPKKNKKLFDKLINSQLEYIKKHKM